MPRKEAASPSPSWVPQAELLLELARLDTAYGDLYRQRARQLAAKDLSPVDFRALLNAEQAVESLPSDIQRAMDDGTWEQVSSLTEQLADRQRFVSERGPLERIGEQLYEEEEVFVDPFSPGFYWYHRREEQQLPALRDQARAKLGQAFELDPEWKALYQQRREAIGKVQLAEPSASGTRPKGRGEMEQRAREALSQGNLEELKKLAGSMSQAGPAGTTAAASRGDRRRRRASAAHVQVQPRDPRAGTSAGVRGRSTSTTGARRPARCSVTSGTRCSSRARGTWPERGSAVLPKDTPDALRDRIVMFVTRPILTSGGARFVPPLVEEDILVEAFEEGPAGSPIGKTDLPRRLGLESRWGLDQTHDRAGPADKGPEMVKSLGLDPWKFRLVSVPPDVFGAIGARRGWGKHEIWTHLDGYLATRERKLLALVGGDVRYGGVQDLVGVGMGYDSDRLLARFAIVDRRRHASLVSADPAPAGTLSSGGSSTMEMQHEKYLELINRAKAVRPTVTAVAHPCDESSLQAVVEAARLGLIEPILVGPAARLREVAGHAGLDLSAFRQVDSAHSHESAARAVGLVRSGQAEVLMKGSLHTDELMAEVVKRDTGLRTARRVSHCFIMDVPGQAEPLVITDAAVNIAPTLAEKVDIVQNAIDLVRDLGSRKCGWRSSPPWRPSIRRCRRRWRPRRCARWRTAGRSPERWWTGRWRWTTPSIRRRRGSSTSARRWRDARTCSSSPTSRRATCSPRA